MRLDNATFQKTVTTKKKQINSPLYMHEGGKGRSKVKGKGKVHLRTGHEGPEGEQMYNSTLSLTSALDVVDGQRHAPVVLPPVNTRYPLYRRPGGPQRRSGRVRKSRLHWDSIPGPYNL